MNLFDTHCHIAAIGAHPHNACRFRTMRRRRFCTI